MESIDDSIRVSLHLDPDDTLPIPECVEFPYSLIHVGYNNCEQTDQLWLFSCASL